MLLVRNRIKWGPKGAWAPSGPIFFYNYYIFHFCSWISLLLNKPNYSHPNTSHLTQKLNKNNKNIHNSDCISAKKKKKKKLFYYQRIKKLCVIREDKAKFFANTINWYKYQLTVASC